MQFAAIGVALNIVVSLSLFWSIGFLAIALATTLAGWANALLLVSRLRKLGHFKLDDQNRRSLPRQVLASGIMAACVLVAARVCAPVLNEPLGIQIAALFGIVGLGILLYGGLTLALGAVHPRDLKASLGRG